MARVAAKVEESCSMAVLDDNEIVYVMHVPTPRILTTNIRVGWRLPAYPQSMGRILLGGLPSEELDRYFVAVELKPLTRRTIVDPARLRRIIAEDKKKGWSWVNGELEEGICGIAVPLLDSENRIFASMHIVSNTARCSESRAVKTFLPELKSAARQIGSELMMRKA
jgi:IclR family pca regulon transcriptional regulator